MTRARPNRMAELAFSGHGDRPGTPEAPPRRGSPAAALAAALTGLVMVACYCLALRHWVLTDAGAAPARPYPQNPTPGSATSEPIRYPQAGAAIWRAAKGAAKVAGSAGTPLRFQVAVERDIVGIDPQRFAMAIFTTLADPRGWTGGNQWRFQLVGDDQRPDFTVYLATPATRDLLCEAGYDRYTSCRLGDRVVLNVARWTHGVPGNPTDLNSYRQYLINHEIGHRLDHGHELCPGQGQPAPVMQQQTLGLHGCVPNPWPYLDGARYAGPPGEYEDPIPG